MKKLTKMFLMLLAIGAVAFGVTGCGKKSDSSGSSSSSSNSEKKVAPKAEIEETRKVAQNAGVDETNPKAVVKAYASYMAAGEYDKAIALSVPGRDGEKAAIACKNDPSDDDNQKGLADLKQIADSFDSVLKDTEDKGKSVGFRFNVKYVKKIGVVKVDGKYKVFDL